MRGFFVFLFFAVLLNLAIVSASFSLAPGKMFFDVNVGEKVCQDVKVLSGDYTGAVSVRDVWAKYSRLNANLYKFNYSAADKDLEVSYLKGVANFSGEQTFEVCVKANKRGRQIGMLIFTPEARTNIVIEVGAWLFVNAGNVSEAENDAFVNASLSADEKRALEENQKEMAAVTGAAAGAGASGAKGGFFDLKSIIIFVLAFVVVVLAIIMLGKRRREPQW